MTKKEKVSELFIRLWNMQDQQGQQDIVNEALKNLPVKRQLEIIDDWVNYDNIVWDNVFDEDIEQIKEESRKLI